MECNEVERHIERNEAKRWSEDMFAFPTLVFDEIDTGISGTMGHKIADKLSAICTGTQVICVTHLAQIASVASHHYVIAKSTQNELTQTSVRLLSPSEIKPELTRMLGGTEMLGKL